MRQRIGVVGGGIAGLSFAQHASGQGADVTLFEAEKEPGGLGYAFPFEGTRLEAYYHHFFRTDQRLLELLEELGLGDRIEFHPSSVSLYYPEKTYPFSRPVDLLGFDRLSWFSRIVFGLQTLYLQKSRRWAPLEKMSVARWMSAHFGDAIYREIWKPLLWAKFGDYADQIPMSWLWGRINPRSNSREKGGESLGYLRGGFYELFAALAKSVESQGGRLRLGTMVKQVAVKGEQVTVTLADGSEERFDRVVMAVDTEQVVRLTPDLPDELKASLGRIDYYAILSLVLTLPRPLGSSYWINNASGAMEISGVIEHTNLIPAKRYNGRSVVYLFRYLSPENPLFVAEEEEIATRFMADLNQVHPSFDPADVIRRRLFRSAKATPVYHGAYSHSKPGFDLVDDRLYMLNTAQIYPEDRNLNNGIALGRQLADRLTR